MLFCLEKKNKSKVFKIDFKVYFTNCILKKMHRNIEYIEKDEL